MNAYTDNPASLKRISAGLGIATDLLPWYPELLADIWNMGSWPERIVELLQPLSLPAGTTRVLEPGCGKGAVGITIAGRFRFSIHGVDQFEPFVQEAHRRVRRAGVTGFCRYEVADMHEILKTGGDYDIAIFAAVGNVLGDFRQTVARLRQVVRPGGYIVIDDGFFPANNISNTPVTIIIAHMKRPCMN